MSVYTSECVLWTDKKVRSAGGTESGGLGT
jgi:hypothetical protein